MSSTYDIQYLPVDRPMDDQHGWIVGRVDKREDRDGVTWCYCTPGYNVPTDPASPSPAWVTADRVKPWKQPEYGRRSRRRR